MNEELKIIIRAVTADAQKEMAKVRKELEAINDEGTESGKAVDKAMKGMAVGVAAATAAITALTAAMTSLGKKAQEVQKGFEKLNTTFKNAGSTTQQASNTYKELFSFLGDHDKAVETAQSLALITNEEAKLAEWTNILQGAFAEMGDKLPTEGLAEAANETIKVGQVVGVMADALNWAGVSEDGFNQALAQTTSLSEREALVRSTLNGLYGNSAKIYEASSQATLKYNESQAELNLTLASASAYTTPLLTALNGLSTTLLSSFAPALQTIAVYLTAFIQLMSEAIQWVAQFFGMFSEGGSNATADVKGYQAAMKTYMNSLQSAFGGTNSELEETVDNINAVKKATMGFDELNVVSDNSTSTSTSGGASGGSLPVAPDPADYNIGTANIDMSAMTGAIDEAKKKLEVLLPIVGAIGTAIVGWKIYDTINDVMRMTEALRVTKNVAETIGNKGFEDMFGVHPQKVMREAENRLEAIKSKIGGVMTAVGLTVAVLGTVDAVTEGLDLGNMAAMIGGLATAVGGLYLSLGPLAASIGGVVAGLALMVVGVIDFVKNGPSVQNTILIIGGAIATAVALATMGIGPLVAAIIGAVAAVVAFTAAIILEEPAIKSTKETQEALTAAKEAAAAAENSYINAVDASEAALKRLKAAEEAAGMSGEELYKQVQSGQLDYANMTDAQKELYKAYLDNEQKQKDLKTATEEFNAAKKAETIASLDHEIALGKEAGSYDKCKESIIAAFNEGSISADEARDLLAKSMSEMSTDAQKAFMEDIPGDIKEGLDPNKYETTRKKMADWFSQAWEDIKGAFAAVGTWFSDLFKGAWEGIKTAWAGVVQWFKDLWYGIQLIFDIVVHYFGELFTNAWEGIKTAWAAVVQWFSDLWEGIKNVFAAIGEWFSGVFTAAWEGIKTAWNAVITWFSNLWVGIQNVFIAVGTWFATLFTNAWTGIKTAWNAVITWFSNVWQGIKNVFASIGTWFSTLFSNAWTGIKNAWSSVKQWFSDIWTGIKNIFNSVGTWFSSVFSNAWTYIKNAWSSVTSWFGNIWYNIQLVFYNIGSWFSGVFSGAWTAIKNAFSSVSSFFLGIWTTIKGIFSSIGSTIGNAVSGAFKTAINWVLEKAIGLINGFIKALNTGIDIINAIPGVSITKLTLLDVPQLAKGGIATGDTLAHIGEEGYKEAVLPLERNTEWMDVLADRIAARNDTPTRIVLALDGKELGYATINSINSITRQTGTLQLQLV